MGATAFLIWLTVEERVMDTTCVVSITRSFIIRADKSPIGELSAHYALRDLIERDVTQRLRRQTAFHRADVSFRP